MRALLLVPALLLAGCGSADEKSDEGTSISIRGGDGGNGFAADLGKDGRGAIDVPGFKAAIDLPKIQLNADDFKLNGVALPTGSKITSMNVAGGNGDRVVVNFSSPVATTAVRDWFQGRLAREGFTLKADGDALSGTTDDGKAFTLTTRDAGGGNSESVISIGG